MDPTDYVATLRARTAQQEAGQAKREQEDADIASIVSTPAGRRLFARLLRTRYLDHTDPIMQSAARGAPKVLAEIIVSLAAEAHPK